MTDWVSAAESVFASSWGFDDTSSWTTAVNMLAPFKLSSAAASGSLCSASLFKALEEASLLLCCLSPLLVGTVLLSDSEGWFMSLTLDSGVPCDGNWGLLQTATRLAAAKPGEILSEGSDADSALDLVEDAAVTAPSVADFRVSSLTSTSNFSDPADKLSVTIDVESCCGSELMVVVSSVWSVVGGGKRAIDFCCKASGTSGWSFSSKALAFLNLQRKIAHWLDWKEIKAQSVAGMG